ncbi:MULTISPECIES: FHA domain-containing protein [Streptosporangium]|uniref:non-specific serine/threonine protein kinase n=1 Tax=Streptosporangium brasiliense TaxID=47480 RepID=A0ABT9RGF8_9ACTN|nr:FHA domain-containing protein [Streptosporangium brasiliense]MDP9867936.1 hypothetical protein [Streptosporangium brasiliense]
MTRPATITLKLVKGKLARTEYVFDERTTCVLGRADDCAPRLPDDADHRTVSRHHCLLDINPPDARIRDFGSLNGTYVNGEKIGQRAAHQTPEEAAALPFPEHDLSDGDEIRIGETVFRVGVQPAAGGVQRTLELPRCKVCDREVGSEVGARSGEYVCAACQARPAAVAAMLLKLAYAGRRDLSSIAGYTILRELGRGGMGAVFLARHQGTGEEVALKVMLPKVGDFGLAKAFDQAGLSGLTRTGTAAGKPWYMPRQQVINFRNAAPAVDVWTLAACLYHALTARYPRDFPAGRDPWQVVLQSPPVPIRRRNPEVPAALAAIIDKALQEKPAIGYQSAAELHDALRTMTP